MENANEATTQETTDDRGQSSGDFTQAKSGNNTGQVGTENTGESTETDPLQGRDLEAEAKEFAVKKLGKNWDKENPGLVQILKDKNYVGFQTNVERIAKPKSTTQVVRKKGKTVNEPKFSKSASDGEATTVKRITEIADKLFDTKQAYSINDETGVAYRLNTGSPYSPLQIHATVKDAVRALRGTMTKEELSNAQGFIDPRGNGEVSHIIAENITVGNEAGVLAHEVGVHLGLEQKANSAELDVLASGVDAWADAKKGSVEKTIYDNVVARIAFARLTGMPEGDVNIEKIAYAVEEAVNAGVVPSKETESTAANWLSKFSDFIFKLFAKIEITRGNQSWIANTFGDTGLIEDVLQSDLEGKPVLPAEMLVALSQGAAKNVMRVPVLEQGAMTDDVEVLAGFYAGTDLNRSTGKSTVYESGVQGEEIHIWEEDATFGGYSNIFTESEFDGEGEMLLEVFSEDEAGTILSLRMQRISTIPYVYALTVYGPDGKLKTSTETKDIGDGRWTRLEGVSRRELLRLLTEARRRITRSNYGNVPNILWDRVTGAVAANQGGEARRGAINDEAVFKKFSLKPPSKKETKKHISWVRKNLGDDAAAMLTNLKTVAETPVDVTKNLDRTVRDNEAKMPSARKWYDLMLEAEATKNEVLMMVESVINQARKFSMERKELINDFIGSSTFYQKWGYDPQWTDRKTGKPVAVVIDPVMKKKYDRLSAKEQQLVRDLFSHGRTMQIMMQDIAENLGVSKFFTFDSKLAGPYSPLKRFGKYVGELKSQKLLDAEESLAQSPTAANRKRVEELKVSPDDYVISFFESLGAADTFVVANQNKFASAEASEKSVSFDDARPGGAQAYAKILGAVNANLAGLDQPSKDAMAKMIKDMYFQTLDDSNARLSGTKRLNRAGFDKDMLRAFADHGMAQSSLLAQMKHGGEISAALVEARKEAKANPRELLPVYNKIALKFQRVMTPRTGMLATVQANIMKVNSTYMLTSSIGYMLQNMTQPYFAVANIAKVSGFADQPAVWGRLFSGYKVAKEVVNTSFLNQVKNVASFGLLGGNSTVELNLNKAAPELQPVLKQLQLRGLLDVGVTEDLRHVNMSPNMVIRGYDEITHRLYQSSRYVEANNRIASAVAAFKTAQRNPKKMKQLKMTPTEFAVRIVQDTQGNFSQLDAPALFDGNLKLPFQFRKYQMQMGWLHVDATKDALKGADPETKQAGWRVLSLMLGYTGVFGGLAAIPMSNFATAILQAAIGWASGDGDEENPPKGLERWIRENVEDERMATLLARGVPAALGWDFSQKLDQSDLFMPYNSKYVTANPDRDGALLFAAQLFLGPTGTTLGNIGNSMDFVNRGNIPRAAEYALPKGLRSYLETYRYATRGYETRDKTKITDPTSFNVVDFLTNVVGLPSTDINQIKWTRGQQVEIIQWFSKRTSAITRGYLAAYDARDRKAQAKYRDEFRELQKAKDRVRPLFKGSMRVLTRSPLSDLIKAPRNRQTKQLRMDSITGR